MKPELLNISIKYWYKLELRGDHRFHLKEKLAQNMKPELLNIGIKYCYKL